MKKSLIAFLLCCTLLLTLVSCAAKNSAPDDGMDPNFNAPNQSIIGSPTEDMEEMEGIMDSISPEDYGKFIENKFILTEEENVSTFSADVDTASYAYFRRLVNAGYSLSELIATAGSSIRTEEMINYFDYGYAAPAEGELFSTQMQITQCPWNSDAKLMILGLQAQEIEAYTRNNLVFLIDVSGSMNSPDKLALLKAAFAHLIDQLGEDDRVSIVTYSGAERVVLSGCSGAKKEIIMNAVNSLSAGGSTNGEAGMRKAYELAEANFIEGGNNRIILASDGDLNVGISSVEEIERYISEKRESGVFLSVLGFGTGNYQDAKMETIADCGNGVYYYIDSEREAEKVFGSDLLSTLYTVAKDVKLQLTFDPSSIQAYRLVGYENRLLNKEDFEDDTKDAGEVGAGHSLTVCYELMLTEAAPSTENSWMTLGVRYKAPDGEKSEERNYTFGKEVYSNNPDENARFIMAVVETSMILHKSQYTSDRTLEGVLETLDALSINSDEYKTEFRTLIRQLVAK